jgi:HEAT repeat protein
MFSAFTLRKLRSEDSKVRRSALEQLKSLDSANLLDEVIRMMVEDRDGPIRDEAEKAIERTKPAGAPERLKPLLGHQNPQHRYSAARALHGIG